MFVNNLSIGHPGELQISFSDMSPLLLGNLKNGALGQYSTPLAKKKKKEKKKGGEQTRQAAVRVDRGTNSQ